jgi:outer membrane lipoprotein-sorting protein
MISAGLAACAVTTAPVFSGDDRQAVMQVETYLKALVRFQAQFTSTGTDGDGEGFVWMERPGRLRVEFVRPRPRLLLARNGHLLLADHLTGGTQTMPVSRTPLDILLAPTIALSGAVSVTSIQRRPGVLQLSLIRTGAPQQGQLTLRFSENPLTLTGVLVQDQSGRTTDLTLSHMVRDQPIDPSHFDYHPDSSPASE